MAVASMTNADLDDNIVELNRAREQTTAWQAKWIIENGRPLPILANAIIALRSQGSAGANEETGLIADALLQAVHEIVSLQQRISDLEAR